MEIKKVTDASFLKYGRIVTDLPEDEISELIRAMENTPEPDDVVYEPSVPELEALPAYKSLSEIYYGEMPIEIGYCNGHNQLLNAVEYHRDSEINIASRDMILILGLRADIDPETFKYDTAKMEAFFVPAGMAVEVFATTLHYAPCGVDGSGFRTVIVLPKYTNYPLEKKHDAGGEDKLITARNKWLIAHKDGGQGDVFIGLEGENLRV
ncbi:protein of unknown function [Lachnospiraceae bacterium]|nr:protein of unknown function [Lachnospiraceae bacterium]